MFPLIQEALVIERQRTLRLEAGAEQLAAAARTRRPERARGIAALAHATPWAVRTGQALVGRLGRFVAASR